VPVQGDSLASLAYQLCCLQTGCRRVSAEVVEPAPQPFGSPDCGVKGDRAGITEILCLCGPVDAAFVRDLSLERYRRL
jgi:hypothetical protein